MEKKQDSLTYDSKHFAIKMLFILDGKMWSSMIKTEAYENRLLTHLSNPSFFLLLSCRVNELHGNTTR